MTNINISVDPAKEVATVNTTSNFSYVNSMPHKEMVEKAFASSINEEISV